MKRLLFPIIFSLFCLTFFSFENLRSEGFKAAPLNSGGPSGGQSGAPGEQNCTSCHNGTTQDGTNENQLIINNDIGFGVTQYVPGSTYTVNLSMASNPAKKGFQVTALNAANQMAGNFVAGSNTQLKTANIGGGQRKYATHKSSSNTSATQVWNWTWEAPSTDQGAVTFYVATNKANNNNNDNGDLIYLSQHVILAENASIGESSLTHNFDVGFSQDKGAAFLSFNTLSHAQLSLNLVTLDGQSAYFTNLGSSKIGNNEIWVEIPNELSSGIYFVHFFIGNKTYSAPISILR